MSAEDMRSIVMLRISLRATTSPYHRSASSVFVLRERDAAEIVRYSCDEIVVWQINFSCTHSLARRMIVLDLMCKRGAYVC